jgi:hypothetical protein
LSHLFSTPYIHTYTPLWIDNICTPLCTLRLLCCHAYLLMIYERFKGSVLHSALTRSTHAGRCVLLRTAGKEMPFKQNYRFIYLEKCSCKGLCTAETVIGAHVCRGSVVKSVVLYGDIRQMQNSSPADHMFLQYVNFSDTLGQ